jgi:uracil phosphoribosyltransferase
MGVFPQADNAFLAAYRKHDAQGDFTIQADYCTCPDVTGRVLIVADPMLATGASLLDGIDKFIAEGGQPSNIHVIVAIASQDGRRCRTEWLRKARFHRCSNLVCGGRPRAKRPEIHCPRPRRRR